MFSNKIFEDSITQGAYTNLKKAIPHDKNELKVLYEDTIRGQIKTSVAEALISDQFREYVALKEKIKKNISWSRKEIALTALPFIDEIFIDDFFYRDIDWVSVSKDYPEVKAFKTKDDRENNSNRLFIDFQDEVYDRLVDEANKSRGEGDKLSYWGEIFAEIGFLLSYKEMLEDIESLLNNEFAQTLKCISTVRKAEQQTPAIEQQNFLPPTIKVENGMTAELGYRSSDWYRELSPENKEELDKILINQPGFKPYINILFEKKYFVLDENYTPTLGEMSNPDLKRLIRKLTPQSIKGKYMVWESFFQLDPGTFKNCSDIEKSKSFIEILKDLGIEE